MSVERLSDIQADVSVIRFTFPFGFAASRSQKTVVDPSCSKPEESCTEKGRAETTLFYEQIKDCPRNPFSRLLFRRH